MPDALRTDLNDFLFTPIAADADGMHLTMLSALARAGVDPWHEAAALAALPRQDAAQKLEQMLATVPNGPTPGDATATLAARLVAQLHGASKPRLEKRPVTPTVSHDEEPPRLSFSTLPKTVRTTIYVLAILFLLTMGYRSLAASTPAFPGDDTRLLSE